MAGTPAAEAIDAQAAERAADAASQSAQEANAQAAIAAANATEAARVRMEQIAQENETRLGQFGEKISSWQSQTEQMNGALTALAKENQALQERLDKQATDQATMAEALQKLLTPPVSEAPKEIAPPEKSPNAEGDGPKGQATPAKRKIIRI